MIRLQTSNTTAALLTTAISLAWFVWCVYLFIMIAKHVNAWPF